MENGTKFGNNKVISNHQESSFIRMMRRESRLQRVREGVERDSLIDGITTVLKNKKAFYEMLITCSLWFMKKKRNNKS